MKAKLAPIIRDSERLLREVVQTASKMPKDYKWILGARLRDDSVTCLLLSQKAFRGAQKPGVSLPLIKQLIDLNDGIQALLQVSFDVRAIGSAGRLKELSDIASSIGKQCSGWTASLEGQSLKGANPNGQNPASSASLERPGTLSTRDASSGAQ